jgi:hypothetical protein
MFKKISFFLVVLFIATNLLTACQSSSTPSNVSPTDLITLLNKKSKDITIQPGWLHVTEKATYDVDKENLGTLSNGAVVPLQYQVDTWYHINDRGLVFQYVLIQSTLDGETVQVSVYTDQVIRNLMTNTVIQKEAYSLGAMDYHFSDEMVDFTDRTGKSATLKLTKVDGHQAAIFTLDETLSEPTTTENYNQPVYGTRTIAYYDTQSGLLFRFERIRIFKDGSERTFYYTDITVEQNANPPADILDYLKGVN